MPIEEIRLLETELSNLGITFNVSSVDPNNFKNLSTKGHITRAAFMRLELARTFADLEKLLYLDSDLVVTGSLNELWNIDLNDKPIAAVINAGKDGSVRLGLSEEHQYFNSGVLLLDLNYFRQNDIRQRAYKWLEENNSSRAFHDQDAFNVLYEKKVHILPKRYNMQAFWFRFYFSSQKTLKADIKKEYKKHKIIHFSSGRKPWQEGDMHPMKRVFLKYYKGEITTSSDSLAEKLKRAYLYCYYTLLKLRLN
jgi:lipopolysaccharide biosynthesis glycosyltransferase